MVVRVSGNLAQLVPARTAVHRVLETPSAVIEDPVELDAELENVRATRFARAAIPRVIVLETRMAARRRDGFFSVRDTRPRRVSLPMEERHELDMGMPGPAAPIAGDPPLSTHRR